jgi:hypothetical protein
MTRTWKDNAAEFAALDRGEAWPFARLVACSVEKGNGQGRKPRNDRYKVSASQFAEVAGTSAPRVLRYLDAWQDAAKRGWVTDADLLTPADAHEIPDPKHPWRAKDGGVYNASKTGGQINDVSQIAAKAARDPEYARRVMSEVTGASPEAEVAARQVLDKRYAEAPKPIEPTHGTYSDPVELTSRFRRLHTDVDAIIRLVIEGQAVVTDAQRDAVLAEVKWLRTALGYIEDGVQAGSLDQALAEMLAAES